MTRPIVFGVAVAVCARAFVVPSPSRLGTRLASSPVGDYDGTDPWGELGLQPGASAADIRRAYRRAALKTHPDVNKTPEAADKFRRISAAYELVKDREKLAKWERLKRRRSAASSSRSAPGGSSWRPPSQPEYDDAGGDSFGAIFSDMLRGIASSPRASARAVVDDLLEILEQIEVDPSGGPRTFATDTERRRAEVEQRDLVDKLDFMLKNQIEPQLASAKASEAAARARNNNVDDLLAAVERTAGLKAKKAACERQLKLARRELDAIATARVGNPRAGESPPPRSTTYRSRPASYSARASSSSPPAGRGIDERAALRDRRIDEELDELKRSLGGSGGKKK